MRYVLLILMLLIATPAQAQEVRGAEGVFCDTKEQVDSFASLVKAGKTGLQAVEEVNKAAGRDTACGVLRALVIVLGIEEKTGYSIAHVMVVGVMTPGGPAQVAPTEQFFALAVKIKPAVDI